MKMLLILVNSLVLLGLTEANTLATPYDEIKLNSEEISELKKLIEDNPLRNVNKVSGPGLFNNFLIDPANQHNFGSDLSSLESDFSSMLEDLKDIIGEHKTRPGYEHAQSKMNWTHYQPLPVIYNWLDKLTVDYPDLITQDVIGYSYEKRPIKAIRISSKPGNKAIFIESNIDSGEWISSAAATCFINKLVSSPAEGMKLLLENYDWIFVPILNPDGFVYSHDVDRLWRKNRKPTGFPNSSAPCYGTNLDRNFGYIRGHIHDYDVPCSQWYSGNKSDSEPEVLALQNFVNTFENGYIRMYLALHGYGNNILLPFGIDTIKTDQMMPIATAFADAAKVKYGTNFESHVSDLLNYPVSGSSMHWQHGVKKIPFTASIELHDNVRNGSVLPPSQILKVCDEVTDGLVAMIEKATKEGLFALKTLT